MESGLAALDGISGAVLDLVVADPRGGAVDRTGMATREAALRPLLTAVRRARMAACNALGERDTDAA